MNNKLKFLVSPNADRIQWLAEGLELSNRTEADFWRLMADDGYYMDMQIKSSQQRGCVLKEGNTTTIRYDSLVTDTGRVVEIGLILTITEEEDRLVFDSKIINRDQKVRADELEYPYVELTQLCGKREEDILIRPNGLGEKIVNPWKALADSHTEYMGSDYLDIKTSLTYPRPATMSWFGIQSADHFLYIGRHDERGRICCMLNSVAPRDGKEPYLASAICQYGFVRPSEELALPSVVVSLQKGDWRIGSDIYGAFARSTFYHPVTPRKWVQDMTGWQRVILRHQYGEIFWKYEDLPMLYLEGKDCGLDTLMVFGWWKGRFDNGYPLYEPDEELGGAEKLKEAIEKIQSLGGHVILYNNGILIDKQSDFYKEYGYEAARVNLDGNHYEDHYVFSHNGTLLRNYGYKSFVDACQASREWPRILMRNAKQKLSFDPDSIFFDQVGGRCYPCFNSDHRHGYRADDEPIYRRQNMKEIRELLEGEQAMGTEYVNDFVDCEFDYVHGSDYGTSYYLKARNYDPNRHLSEMFRRTFPEMIISNRHVHDCHNYFKESLNHAFIMGLRFDVSIYRGRVVDVKGLPEYEEYIGKLIALRKKYHEFFYHGTFVCNTDLTLPVGVVYTEYEANGERMFAFWNKNDEKIEISVLGKNLMLAAESVECMQIGIIPGREV